jgi:glycosyltransferase involved in cell wall biosynthesis
MTKSIAIVIPVYKEEKNLNALHDRLESVTIKNSQFSWEYIFVNDGSPDSSFGILSDIAKKDKKTKVIDLSRNFGKEVALSAGVHESGSVDAVICIDADLQHPPELIPTLIEKWQQGAEVVVTVRKGIKGQTLIRKIGSNLYYWLMKRVCNFEIIPKSTDFRLYDASVIKAFREITERERMFRSIMDWMGFKKSIVEFDADARNDGNATYSFPKLWSLATSSLTSFSLWPLRIAGYLGLIITSLSGVLLVWMMINYFILGNLIYSPLAIAMIANTFLIGIVLMAIGIVAVYIGTIHIEVINRPLYLIRKKINF